MISQGRRQFEGFPNNESGAQQLSCSTMNTDDDRQTEQSRGLQSNNDASKQHQLSEKPGNASVVNMEVNNTRNVYMVSVSSQEPPVSSTPVMSSNIVYTRATHTEDPTVVSSLQRQSKMSHLALDSESQLLLSGVQSIPEQVPLILTEGDAEEHESLTVMSGNEHLQAVSTQAVLGGNPSSATGGLMVFSSNDISPTGQLIPINGTNLLVLQSLDSHGQVIHPNQVILNGQAEMLRQSEQLKMVNECKLGNKQYKCPQEGCAKITPTSSKLKLHMLSHTGERPHKCPLDGCEWAFTTAYKLKRHIRGHTGERPFVCDINDCGKCFTTTYNLKTHQKSHKRQQENVCTHDDCGQTFSTLHKLKVHEKKHQVESEIHICAYEGCGKEFKTLSNYNAHYKTHNNERPHVCVYEGCDKRFTKASKLKLHTRTHTGERPFVCEEEGCDWSFTSSYKLKRHMRKHTGERPFACQFAGCGKSFTRASHMRTHALSHTGQKPYVCPLRECRKGFTAASSLNIHMRKHSGDKPFKCDFEGCDKAYTTGANLRLHQKRHEVDKDLSQDEEVMEKTGQVTGHTRPVHNVEIGGVNSVVETVASQVPNAPYLVMHTFTGDEFSSEDPSLAVVQFSSEETFPPQTPVSTIDSSSGICFQFANTDAYTSNVHGNAASSITGLSFTAANPLPSPGTHYVQSNMGEDTEVLEASTSETQFLGKCASGNERYIVDEESSRKVLSTREKEDEDLALPTMVVFTPSTNQSTTVSSQPTTDVVTRVADNHPSSRSNISHLTMQRSCGNATIDQFAPPAIIFQGEEMKSHDNEVKLNYTEAKENTSQTSSLQSGASLTGLSNLNLNLSSLSHEIDKSPGTSFISDVSDHTLDHESTINLQDLR